ncbi:anthranilate synthase component I [Tuberibacillus sp. Marseille-P3662]|uniref:anthranilate synthase component I n=1 Tax=Tuberibacillus sp. Marseille-P3662 TaxID=1965358 RepID=UPI001C38C6E9|nr:anthranilate synthase component I [Tuberibacillus sp. Marseille-P3662]
MSLLSNFSATTETTKYETSGYIEVERTHVPISKDHAQKDLLPALNQHKGALFTSRFEYPGRYTRWDIGFVDPPIELKGYERQFVINALNERGEVLLQAMADSLKTTSDIDSLRVTRTTLSGYVGETEELFTEEQRSKQPSVFTVIRAISALFYSTEDDYLGLYGAFGYDLVFQFESIPQTQQRDADQADITLFLPDQLTVVDHQMDAAYELTYEFSYQTISTKGLLRHHPLTEATPPVYQDVKSYESGNYARIARQAKEAFYQGNLYEVVPSQTLYEPCKDDPADIFDRLLDLNPSPYGFLINLGDEHLIGASPEMYVRVEGDRVETCPISGTIKRGRNAVEDADRIRELLNSTKDETELTMCTDVDRNDKSRICEPGSVNIIGRRQIEMYSHLIHTVDHVEGKLQSGYDALDAFLTHMWAVTVTGAPKRAAIQWVEDHEASPRKWYGGAVGYMKFNGDMNTGLTLRTIRLQHGLAEIRVGATLLHDSVPDDEEQETLTKAQAMLKTVRNEQSSTADDGSDLQKLTGGIGKTLLLVDHEDSFTHTLANYFRQTGATVQTVRQSQAQQLLLSHANIFDGVVLSPGPGRPDDFDMQTTIKLSLEHNLPIFGVCLGMQGIVEYFGGGIDTMITPTHGKQTTVTTSQASKLFHKLPKSMAVSRYHSLYAGDIPEDLAVTAYTDERIPMAVEHKTQPVFGVQFHPESLLMMNDDVGLTIINDLVTLI